MYLMGSALTSGSSSICPYRASCSASSRLSASTTISVSILTMKSCLPMFRPGALVHGLPVSRVRLGVCETVPDLDQQLSLLGSELLRDLRELARQDDDRSHASPQALCGMDRRQSAKRSHKDSI